MTLHAAKGLEFPAVWIVGLEDGLIPHVRNVDNDEALEEERRLLFVGMTRAEELLTLSYARNRTVNGRSQATIRSEFLRSLNGLEFSYGDEPGYDSDSSTAGLSDDDDPYMVGDHDPYVSEEEQIAFQPGRLVRHPKWGLGRIQEVMPSRENSRVLVQFVNGTRMTLVLKYAKLEAL